MNEWGENECQVREVTEEDLPDMARLFTKHPSKERETRMYDRYRREPEGWYVAVWEGEVVGCCQVVFPVPGDAWLQWMRIAPEMQGAGVGATLIQQVEEKAILQGAQVLRLSTAVDNDRVHAMMGGSRSYTEWVRWTRLTRLQQAPARSWVGIRRISENVKWSEVQAFLTGQRGYQSSFRTITCPTDFRKIVSIEPFLSGAGADKQTRPAVLAAKSSAGEIEAVVFYAFREGELRILQVVAATTVAGLCAVAAALRTAGPKDRMTLQAAGLHGELLRELKTRFQSNLTKRQDFYVFGKRVAGAR